MRKQWYWLHLWVDWHLGNRLFGRWADRVRQPVQAYGSLEIAVGIYAFLYPGLDRLTNHLFVALGSPIVAHPGWLLALKGTLSAALLLGPTILMGGTLPLLAAWLQKFSSDDAGRRSARFYSVNSLGAVLGAAFAGFWLVQTFGMIETLQLTAAVNVIVGTLAIALSRAGLAGQRREKPTRRRQESKPPCPEPCDGLAYWWR